MAAGPESAHAPSGGGFLGWIDQRFPLTKLWKEQVSEYYAPKNLPVPSYTFTGDALIVIGEDELPKSG